MRKILTPFVAALLLLLTLAPQTMWATNNNASVDPYLTQPLTIEKTATTAINVKFYRAGATSGTKKVSINLQYRYYKNSAWSDWVNVATENSTTYAGLYSASTSAALLNGVAGKIQLRGVNPTGFSKNADDYYQIEVISGASPRPSISIYGNIMSLIVGYDTDDETAAQATLAAADEIPSEYCFYKLFPKITGASMVQLYMENLICPATKLRSHCYESMFDGLVNGTYGLCSAPTFLATDFKDKDGNGVSNAFARLCYNCSTLTNIHVNFTSPSPDGCISTTDNNLTNWLYNCGTKRTIYAPEGFRTCFASDNPNTGLGNAVWTGWTKTQWVYEFPAASTYTLAWSSDGSTPTGGTAEGSYAAETSLTAPTTSKTGYTFSKWRDETNGVDFNGTMPGNDVTYTAQWTANTYYVSFDAGEGSGTMTDQTFTYGTAQNLKANEFTGPAVTVTYDYNDATGGDSPASETVNASFANWMDGETPYDDGEEVSNLTTTNGATVELTAEWDFDQVVTLPSPTKTGYTFVQWEYGEAPFIIIAGGSGEEFTPDEDVTLKAHWNAITYNLTYEGLNGASNSNNPATYTVETATINLANPGTRDGWTFTGWTCGGNPITQITLGSTGDKTITANWEEVVTAFDLEDDHEAGDDYYDDYAALVTAGNAIDITYKRSFKAGRWATFSLPFGYSFQNLSHNTFRDQVFELTSVDYADGRMIINCVKNSTGIVANTPYILIPTSDIDNPTFEGVTPKAIAAGSKTVNNTKDNVYTVEFISTAYKQVMPTGKRTIYISGNRLYYANVDTDIPAFRGYFNLKGGDDVLHIQPRLVIAAPDGETIEQAEEAVAETRKYIENGILVIERNGVKYDAQVHVIK